MNGIEERIRRARPTPAHRGMPLDDRAERELATLTSGSAEASSATAPPAESSSQEKKGRKSPARMSRWVLAACLTAIAGTIGYQAVIGDDTPPAAEEETAETFGAEEESAESESEQEDTVESGGGDADYETFGTVGEALVQTSLVITGVPLHSASGEDAGWPYTVTDIEVRETLFGDDYEGETIAVRQTGAPEEAGLGITEDYVHLEDIEANEVLIFLVEYGDSGDFQPISPADGIHSVEDGNITPVIQPNQIELPETLDELRELVSQYEDAESQH